MNAKSESQGLRAMSVCSIILGLLGAGMFWWVPFGMVLSLAGLTTGFIDWASARRRTLDYRLSIVALLIGAAALTLDIVIVSRGLQIITFGN